MSGMLASRAGWALVLASCIACSPSGSDGGGGGRMPADPEGEPPIDADGGTPVDGGSHASTSTGSPGEPCDGSDSDADGTIDEGCACTAAATQACYPGTSLTRDVGACRSGISSCVGAGEFGGAWSGCEGAVLPGEEICDDGVDGDCDGAIDDGCAHVVNLMLDLDGDCITTSCPPEAPYPVACAIMMDGGDERGCVASTPTSSVVYFQEGDACGAGHVSGSLSCSSEPGAGLTEATCMINKPVRYYPSDRGGCPDT